MVLSMVMVFLMVGVSGDIFAETDMTTNIERDSVLIEEMFTDLTRDHWAFDAINIAVENGVVNGYPDGTFKPDNSVTRAEFIKMLVTALQLPVGEETSPWYTAYVDVAVAEGLHNEKDFNDQWNKSMPRLEMVRIAVRAISESANVDFSWYGDNEFMYEAVSRGIIRGMGGGRLAPEGLTTRAQALTVIERVQDIIAGEQLPVDELALEEADELVGGIMTHPAILYGRYEDIDSLEVARAFFEKYKSSDSKGVRGYGTVENFERVVAQALSLREQVEIIIDEEKEQFTVTIPSAKGTDFIIYLTFMGETRREAGTYQIPFSERNPRNGAVFDLRVGETKVNSVNYYSRFGFNRDGKRFVVSGYEGMNIISGR